MNGLFDEGSQMPASTAPSVFGNLSFQLHRHLAVDVSFWGTGANNDRLSDSQTRASRFESDRRWPEELPNACT